MTKNNIKPYFIEIIPTGYYFFGSERTFLTVEKDKYGDTITNYFAASNLLPQQTAILGMLRHAMLALYGELNGMQSDKDKLIGHENFSTDQDEPYGLIDSVSPVIIFDHNKKSILTPKGFDHQIYPAKENKGRIKDVSFSYELLPALTYLNGNKSKVASLDGFDYKSPIDLLWVDNTGKNFTEEDIFKSITKVGVDKEKTDEAFYKQTYKGLKKSYAFGVWVNFADIINISKLHDILIPFGADQSIFKLIFRTDIENIFTHQTEVEPFKNKVIMLSDAWIPEHAFDNVDFGITEFIDFRYIKSQKRDYYQLNEHSKSHKYVLLKRGSVLYPGSSFDFSVLNNPSFSRIGYNYFKTI
jgi:CRISPR type III-B/RAMP module-associated protein Cmr3